MKKGQGWTKRVTLENLPSFANYLRSAEDREASKQNFAEKFNMLASKSKTPSPFQGVTLNFPNRFSKKTKLTGKQKESPKSGAPNVILADGNKGNLLWRKRITSSDAQKKSEGTAPTGCLRFTQARKDNPNVIDQTKFFRKKLFGKFKWVQIKEKPYEEATTVPFQITIKGKPLGVFPLQIRHKPSGEAGQGNYTTSLHWGKNLTAQIRETVSVDEMFALYSPVKGTQFPFFIEIS